MGQLDNNNPLGISGFSVNDKTIFKLDNIIVVDKTGGLLKGTIATLKVLEDTWQAYLGRIEDAADKFTDTLDNIFNDIGKTIESLEPVTRELNQAQALIGWDLVSSYSQECQQVEATWVPWEDIESTLLAANN